MVVVARHSVEFALVLAQQSRAVQPAQQETISVDCELAAWMKEATPL